MNLVRQMMPGHNQCEITNSRMSDVERIVNDYLGLNMRGGTPMINGHYNEHSQHHYPRRTVGHDHLPERTVVHGNTFYIRHCVFDFGMNDLSFDFALSEDSHATFPFWPKEFIEDSLTVVFMSMLRTHTWHHGSYKVNLRDHMKELEHRGVKIVFQKWIQTARPILMGQHRVHSRRLMYRATFSLASTFQIGKPDVSFFEL